MISPKKLIKMVRKWQSMAMIRRSGTSLPKRIGNSDEIYPSSVSKGHFVVYTTDHRRFVIPLAYLASNIFRVLLKMAEEEEYGLQIEGPITLPCDSVFMEYVSLVLRHPAKDLDMALFMSIAYHLHTSTKKKPTKIL